MAISATEVQRAFTNNNDIAGVLQQAEAMRMKQQELDLNRQEANDRAIYNHQKYMEDKYNIGTGTPIDRITNDSITKAQTALYEALRKSRGRLSQAQAMSITAPYLSGLPAKQQAAKAIRADMDRRRTTFDKDHPELDWNRFEPDALQSAFYDEKGEVRQELDPNAFANFYNQTLANPDQYDKYINERQLNEQLQKGLKNVPAVSVDTPLLGQNNVFWKGKKMPYESVDPRTGALSIVSEPVMYKDQPYDALPKAETESLLRDPVFDTAVRVAARKLDKDIPLEDRKRIAAKQLLENYGRSAETLSLDKTRWDMQRQAAADARTAQHQAFTRGMQIKNFNARQAARAERKGKENVAQSWINIMNDDPQSLTKATSVLINPPVPMGLKKNGQANFIPSKQKVPAIDLTAQIPNGMVNLPDGSGKRMKVYKDATTGGMWTQTYKPVKKDNKTVYEPDESSWKEIPREEALNLVNSLEAQLNKNVTQYDADVEDYLDLVE